MKGWEPSDLALVFVTCPRDPPYFAATLASAFLGDERIAKVASITVAVDADDLACVGALRGHGRVRWVPRTAEESARVAGFHVHHRGCHNYWRALTLAPEDARGVLICEDDLVFRDGWLRMLLECLDEMRAAGLERFILAPYSSYDHEQPPLRRGRYYSSYVASGFYGTQAMFYPPEEVSALRKLLWTHGVETPEAPYDLLIQRRTVEFQHLYGTRVSLVQHTGERSTGLGDGRHRSPSFHRAWPGREEGFR